MKPRTPTHKNTWEVKKRRCQAHNTTHIHTHTISSQWGHAAETTHRWGTAKPSQTYSTTHTHTHNTHTQTTHAQSAHNEATQPKRHIGEVRPSQARPTPPHTHTHTTHTQHTHTNNTRTQHTHARLHTHTHTHTYTTHTYTTHTRTHTQSAHNEATQPRRHVGELRPSQARPTPPHTHTHTQITVISPPLPGLFFLTFTWLFSPHLLIAGFLSRSLWFVCLDTKCHASPRQGIYRPRSDNGYFSTCHGS